ncbi:MAG: CHAT domain-containing protein [Desertimonas sp.]
MTTDPTISVLRSLIDTDAMQAIARAEAALGDGPTPRRGAELWWIIGLAHRELGQRQAAIAAQQRAQSLADAAGVPSLVARVRMASAYDLASGGDVIAALDVLAEVERDLDPYDQASLMNHRGVLTYRLGRLDDAVVALDRAVVLAALHDAHRTELQALSNLGAIHSQRGDVGAARRALRTALDHTRPGDGPTTAAHAHANLAYVATLEGDLPTALEHYAAAQRAYRAGGSQAVLPRAFADHATALAQAGLVDDASTLIDEALALARGVGDELELAELLLLAGTIDLARGVPTQARDRAADAAEYFRRQGRESWLSMASRVQLQSEFELAPDDPGLPAQLLHHAESLRAQGWQFEALTTDLLAARAFERHHDDGAVQAVIDRVGVDAARGRALDRVMLARVLAERALRIGDPTAARRAVSTGIRVVATMQATLGSLETRAHAAQLGADLVEFGARLAVADRRPRELLERIEAMRTMVWRAPLVRPPDDERIAEALARLRLAETQAGDPDLAPGERDAAERRRLRLERTIRDLGRRARVDDAQRVAPLSARAAVSDAVGAVAAYGDRQLLAYAHLDDRLLAVSVERRRTRIHDLGPAAGITDLIDTCSFALHRLNRAGLSPASADAARHALGDALGALAVRLLPPQVLRSDRPFVAVPTGVLHGVPWSALPPLHRRPVSVSASLGGWSVSARSAASNAARRRSEGHDARRDALVALVAGPGLDHAEREVMTIAERYHLPTVLTDDVTAASALAVIDGADLVHLACHGRFRSDNPLFSTLTMTDGPVNVYDLERSAMPEIVVLSACSAGSSTALSGGTLLGLASALSAFGASGVIAPLTPVNDDQLVGLMDRLHEGLADGDLGSEALATAAVHHDGRVDPVAASFLVYGA